MLSFQRSQSARKRKPDLAELPFNIPVEIEGEVELRGADKESGA